MLIIDNRTEIPLDVSRLDWNPDRVLRQEGDKKIIIPLNDPALDATAKEFACIVSAQHQWAWPDLNRTSVALAVDMSKVCIRFALRVDVKPKIEDSKVGGAWAEFEKQRQEAAEADADKTFGDSFPVMLTVQEELAVCDELCMRFNIY